MKTNLHIKNMVCDRCIMVVRNEIEKLGIPVENIKLGEATIGQHLTDTQTALIKENLENLGFSLLDDKKSRIVEQIKTAIIDLIYSNNLELRTNLSDFLQDKTKQDYHHLSSLFSETEGITIEKYFISQKIERIKELIDYNELSLSQIANELNYSSVAYLSNQFKKATGLTPSEYKKSTTTARRPLDKL